MRRVLIALALAPAASLLISAAAAAQGAGSDGPANKYGNTLKRTPRPTAAEISAEDLKTRLYIFADDSMQGRQSGREGNMKGTAYIAAELKRLGLEPAGDNGTYFQGLPYYLRFYSSDSRLAVGGRNLAFGNDFVPIAAPGRPAVQEFSNAQIIFGGMADGDTALQISAAQAAGRVVVLLSERNANLTRVAAMRDSAARAGTPVAVTGSLVVNNQTVNISTRATSAQAAADSVRTAVSSAFGGAAAGGRGGRGGGGGGAGGRAGGGGGGARGGGAGALSRFSGALAIITVDLEAMTALQKANALNPTQATYTANAGAPLAAGRILGASVAPPTIRVTREVATALMGMPVDSFALGAAGRMLNGRLNFVDKYVPEYGRNVVAILRGSDPVLKDEFVAIGAHNDHTGFTAGLSVDHDSLKAYNDAVTKLQIRGADSLAPMTPELRTGIRLNLDSIRAVRPPRRDSVRNGADDDGSGSMAVLEIAEALAMARVKPKRSVVFVWHTAEEAGLNGSAFFTANPTVPREKIVAQINLDMIGRGRAEDIPGGGPDYVAVVGGSRLSTELGKTVQTVNKSQSRPLKLDYRFDGPTTWPGYNNIYGRSDHANYARYGIPIVFFFTGLHGDYHQLTDEPQYIDYPHYNRITNYVRDLLTTVANNPTRPKVDQPGGN